MTKDAVSAVDDPDRRQLLRLASALERFREVDADVPLQQLLVFVWIATHEGQPQRDMIRDLGLATSTASRNVAALSPLHRLGKPGLGLITWEDDPADRRSKLLVLTNKGRLLVSRLGLAFSSG